MRPVFKGVLRFLGGLFLLGLVVLAAVGIVQNGKAGEKTETASAFSFDPYSENRFTAVGSSLLVSADSGLTLFDGRGSSSFPGLQATPTPWSSPGERPPRSGARKTASPC